jgi:hypothetical protein
MSFLNKKPNNPCSGDASTIEYMLASFAKQSHDLVLSVKTVIALDDKNNENDKKKQTNIGSPEIGRGM